VHVDCTTWGSKRCRKLPAHLPGHRRSPVCNNTGFLHPLPSPLLLPPRWSCRPYIHPIASTLPPEPIERGKGGKWRGNGWLGPWSSSATPHPRTAGFLLCLYPPLLLPPRWSCRPCLHPIASTLPPEPIEKGKGGKWRGNGWLGPWSSSATPHRSVRNAGFLICLYPPLLLPPRWSCRPCLHPIASTLPPEPIERGKGGKWRGDGWLGPWSSSATPHRAPAPPGFSFAFTPLLLLPPRWSCRPCLHPIASTLPPEPIERGKRGGNGGGMVGWRARKPIQRHATPG
jgi:hypothetical protein